MYARKYKFTEDYQIYKRYIKWDRIMFSVGDTDEIFEKESVYKISESLRKNMSAHRELCIYLKIF